jgi:hypothetical protein
MTKASLTVGACAALLWAGTVLATPTPQQSCDSARITAWKVYLSCVNSALAKHAKGVSLDASAAFARCRHTYFKNWTKFQSKASLVGSTCVGTRYTDNGDQTVTDNLSGLVWEKKDDLGGDHDKDNSYTWSTGAPWAENGTVFTSFLSTVNGGGGFAGANGWRLPTLAELQTIVLDFACTGAFGGAECTCPSSPCVDPALDASNTQASYYWSSTTNAYGPSNAWLVFFYDGGNGYWFGKGYTLFVRAVRGGL